MDNELKIQIKEEINSLFEWFEVKNVEDIANEKQILEFIQNVVIEFEITENLIAFTVKNIKEFLKFLRLNNTPFKDIISKTIYDKIVDNIISMGDIRSNVIHEALSSSIYSMLISDVLYNGIKNFVLEENFIVKSMPGVSSFMKIGQGLLNKAMPKLEENVDKKLKEFINAYIYKSIMQSEEFLKKSLNEKLLRQFALNIWNKIENKTVAELLQNISDKHIEIFTQIVFDFWIYFKNTKFFLECCKSSIQIFFKEFGKKNIIEFLNQIGITKELAIKNSNFILPVFENQPINQYIKSRLRCYS